MLRSTGHGEPQEHVGVFSLDPVELIAGTLPRTQRRLVEAWAELHVRLCRFLHYNRVMYGHLSIG